jgi:Xaa-Pro aminopeptidase
MLERSPSVSSERPPLCKPHTRTSSSSSGSKHPPFYSNDSSSTLVGSAYERKINDVEPIKDRIDTTDKPEEIKKLMAKDKRDY